MSWYGIEELHQTPPISAHDLSRASTIEIFCTWEGIRRRFIVAETVAFYEALSAKLLPKRIEKRYFDQSQQTSLSPSPSSSVVNPSANCAADNNQSNLGLFDDNLSRNAALSSTEQERGDANVGDVTCCGSSTAIVEPTTVQGSLDSQSDASTLLELMRIELENQRLRHLELQQLRREALEEKESIERQSITNHETGSVAALYEWLTLERKGTYTSAENEPQYRLETSPGSTESAPMSATRTFRIAKEAPATPNSEEEEPFDVISIEGSTTSPPPPPAPISVNNVQDGANRSQPLNNNTSTDQTTTMLMDDINEASAIIHSRSESSLDGTVSLPPLTSFFDGGVGTIDEKGQQRSNHFFQEAAAIDSSPSLPLPTFSSPNHSPLRRGPYKVPSTLLQEKNINTAPDSLPYEKEKQQDHHEEEVDSTTIHSSLEQNAAAVTVGPDSSFPIAVLPIQLLPKIVVEPEIASSQPIVTSNALPSTTQPRDHGKGGGAQHSLVIVTQNQNSLPLSPEAPDIDTLKEMILGSAANSVTSSSKVSTRRLLPSAHKADRDMRGMSQSTTETSSTITGEVFAPILKQPNGGREADTRDQSPEPKLSDEQIMVMSSSQGPLISHRMLSSTSSVGSTNSIPSSLQSKDKGVTSKRTIILPSAARMRNLSTESSVNEKDGFEQRKLFSVRQSTSDASAEQDAHQKNIISSVDTENSKTENQHTITAPLKKETTRAVTGTNEGISNTEKWIVDGLISQ